MRATYPNIVILPDPVDSLSSRLKAEGYKARAIVSALAALAGAISGGEGRVSDDGTGGKSPMWLRLRARRQARVEVGGILMRAMVK